MFSQNRKSHYVCFNCRRDYKQERFIEECHECKSKLFAMGKNFKAPKKKDISQWEKIELLVKMTPNDGSYKWEYLKPYGVPHGGKDMKTLGQAKRVLLTEKRAKEARLKISDVPKSRNGPL